MKEFHQFELWVLTGTTVLVGILALSRVGGMIRGSAAERRLEVPWLVTLTLLLLITAYLVSAALSRPL